MHRRAVFAALLAPAALAGLACSAITGFDDLEFYEPSEAGSVEAGGDAPAGPTDATSDTAADSGDAAAPCGHDFCDDFEGVATPQARWTGLEVVGSGQLSLFAEDGGNTSMRSSITHGLDGGMVVHIARVSKQDQSQVTADGTMPPVTVAFRLKVEKSDPNRAAIVGVIIGNDDGGGGEDNLGLELAQNSGQSELVDVYFAELYFRDGGPNYAGRQSTLSFPLDTWMNVELHINGRPPGLSGGAVLTVGDASDSYGLASNGRPKYLRIDLGLGLGYYEGSSFTSYIDDVKLDYKK